VLHLEREGWEEEVLLMLKRQATLENLGEMRRLNAWRRKDTEAGIRGTTGGAH